MFSGSFSGLYFRRLKIVLNSLRSLSLLVLAVISSYSAINSTSPERQDIDGGKEKTCGGHKYELLCAVIVMLVP